MKEKERLKNIQQINWYLARLKIPIQIGINFDNGEKLFFMDFYNCNEDEYLKYKSIWMSGDREDRKHK